MVVSFLVMDGTPNGVRSKRLAAGLTQQELADRVSVSRQTIGAIEAGTSGCGVELALRLAAALACRVEDLFTASGATVAAELVEPEGRDVATTRVALSRVRGRLVARSLRGAQGGFWATQPAHGLVRGALTAGQVDVGRLQPNRRGVFVAGCDPAAGLLAEHASRGRAGLDALWWPAGNARAVAELARGSVHAVTVHLEPDMAEPSFGFAVERLRVAAWEMGWIVASGNPKGIASAADLARPGIVLANREQGSGARRVLDELLASAGVLAGTVQGYGRVFTGHAEVAEAVMLGVADVGLGIGVAAEAKGLGFIPVRRHVCDLYLPRAEVGEEPARLLLDTLASGRFLSELAAFGPYDTSETGERVD